MSDQAQDLLAQALKLPAQTREELAVQLMGTVGPSSDEAAEVQQAWLEEIDRRIARFESGESDAVPIEDAWPALAGKPWGVAG